MSYYGSGPPGGGYGYNNSVQSGPPRSSGYGYNNSVQLGPGEPGGIVPGRGPPPGADPQLWNWFSAVDTDGSGAVSATELERALINGDWTPFDLDTVKLLMSIFDTDRSGTIGFTEFAGLWKYIKDWQNVFKHFDRDNSSSIDSRELADALRQFGYNLSPRILDLVQKKYGSAPTSGFIRNAPPAITFDRFVRACVVIKQLSESFQRHDADRDGWIQINYDQFMETVLSLP